MSYFLANSWQAWGLRDRFDLFGAAHLGAIGVTLVLLVALCWVARNPVRVNWTLRLELVLAMIILWTYPAKLLTRYYADVGMPVPSLPMHFCDWAAMAAFFGLVFHNDRMIEIAYFWGMAGTLQGLVTPNIEVGFPHPAWFAFFQLHAGVVMAGLYFVIGKRWRPRKGAVLRVFLLANFYLIGAGLVNLLSVENNYGFLRSKPLNGSLMDKFGPWPYYIFVMQGMALLVFVLFDLPFWRGRKRRAAAEVAG